MLGPQAANYRLTGKVKPRTGSRSTNSGAAQRLSLQGRPLRLPLGVDAEDGRARVRARSAAPTSIDDPRYRTNAERVKHAAELDAIIGEFIAQHTQAENVAFFEKAEVTIGPIYDISQIVEDPHFIERELLADYPDADMGAFPMHHVVPRLSRHAGLDPHARRRGSASTTARCWRKSAWTTPGMRRCSPPAWCTKRRRRSPAVEEADGTVPNSSRHVEAAC